MSDLESMNVSIGAALEKLGVGSIEILVTLTDEWDALAGTPWSGTSRPIIVRHGELLVEADPPSSVRLLEYAIGDLIRRLDERFGVGAIASVKVLPKRLP